MPISLNNSKKSREKIRSKIIDKSIQTENSSNIELIKEKQLIISNEYLIPKCPFRFPEEHLDLWWYNLHRAIRSSHAIATWFWSSNLVRRLKVCWLLASGQGLGLWQICSS